MAVFLTLVQKKQIRINIHKRNNTKNTVNTSMHITKTHTHTHTHTLQKQVKTTTVQDTRKWNSHWSECAVGGVRHPQHTQTSSNSSTIAADNNNAVTNTRCCRYSYLRSWWWVMVPSETCRAVSRWNKLRNVASCWIYIRILLRCTDPWTLKKKRNHVYLNARTHI